MKIAQIASVFERIPPKKYGGTERIISTLTEHLVKRGHEVTLFASGDSVTSANLVSVVPKSLRELNSSNIYGLNELNSLNYGLAYAKREKFDIIHDHNSPLSLPAANISTPPVVITIHHYFYQDNIPLYTTLNNPYFVAISNAQIPKNSEFKVSSVIYNGLDMDNYPFSEKEDGYLLFVGRIHPEKGLHNAIKAAQILNMPLIIAARYTDSIKVESDYFNHKIKPLLSDRRIKWVGEVDEKKRNKLMSKALCLLHPVEWPEPFGLVMIEAMACGAPVVAFDAGSIPEVVSNGKTGFVVKNLAGMIRAIKKIKKINRVECRKYVLSKFSAERMVDQYENLYKRVLEKKDSLKTYQDFPPEELNRYLKNSFPSQKIS